MILTEREFQNDPAASENHNLDKKKCANDHDTSSFLHSFPIGQKYSFYACRILFFLLFNCYVVQ